MRRAAFGLVLVLGAGCSSSATESTTADAGFDDTADAVADGPSLTDSTKEPDTFVPDTLVPDTFVPDTFVPDTSMDASSPETAIDAGAMDAGKPGIFCGTDPAGETCASGQVCCFNTEFSVGICKSALMACASGSSRIGCTGSADCGGNHCCANRVMGSGHLLGTACAAECKPIGSGYTSSVVCSWLDPVAGECPGSTSCLYAGYPFGECL